MIWAARYAERHLWFREVRVDRLLARQERCARPYAWMRRQRSLVEPRTERRPIPFDHAFETRSPRERAVLVQERARRTVRVEEREAHGLTCGLLDSARALEVVEVRPG
jgi:hypothetical protein